MVGKKIVLAVIPALLYLSCSDSGKKRVMLPENDKIPGKSFLESTGESGKNIGFLLYDPKANQVVTSHNRNSLFIPASTTKIATAAAALENLGPEYTFKTLIAMEGVIEKGTLHGTLYLKGMGDPALKAVNLSVMIDRLRTYGIKKVVGRYVYDEGRYKGRKEIDSEMDKDRVYNTGISSLSVDFNRIYAWWEKEKKKNRKDDDRWKVYLTPQLKGFKTGRSEREKPETITFHYKNSRGSDVWLLSAKPPRAKGFSRLPVKNPGLYTARLFRKLCSVKGIKLPEPVSGIMPQSASILALHKSSSLMSLTDSILTYSNNQMAEMILLEWAYKTRGLSSVGQSARWLGEYWKKELPRVDWKGFRLINGSGLTSKNRISPDQMVSILLHQKDRMYDGRSFYSMLPVSGWKWSLVSRLNKPETAFRVWAKTGTINYATSLAGMLYTKSGRKLLFAIFIQDLKKRRAFEKKRDKRSKKTGRKVHDWLKRNREIMDSIITRWVVEF